MPTRMPLKVGERDAESEAKAHARNMKNFPELEEK
jgi:hypothetical protein